MKFKIIILIFLVSASLTLNAKFSLFDEKDKKVVDEIIEKKSLLEKEFDNLKIISFCLSFMDYNYLNFLSAFFNFLLNLELSKEVV